MRDEFRNRYEQEKQRAKTDKKLKVKSFLIAMAMLLIAFALKEVMEKRAELLSSRVQMLESSIARISNYLLTPSSDPLVLTLDETEYHLGHALIQTETRNPPSSIEEQLMSELQSISSHYTSLQALNAQTTALLTSKDETLAQVLGQRLSETQHLAQLKREKETLMNEGIAIKRELKKYEGLVASLEERGRSLELQVNSFYFGLSDGVGE